MEEINNQFDNIKKVISQNIADSLQHHEYDISKLLVKLEIIDICQRNIQNNCIDVFKEVQNDLLNSVIFLTQAFYRNSYMCLRSAMELSLSFIYYTDRNYEFLLWKNNYIDMSWTKISSQDNGILCDKYLQLFCSDTLNTTKLIDDVEKCYHDCSEYVHGKYQFMQSINNIGIKYETNHFTKCFDQIIFVCDCIITLMFIRFGKELKYNFLLEDFSDHWKGLLRKYGVNINE
uniref:hypothetical protein n=1 Tax=Clostridium sp. 12(A) TaxID=1163671 RepID=UPI000465F2BB|nr:hypothetical protein [Clostridium sp. 12(A)]